MNRMSFEEYLEKYGQLTSKTVFIVTNRPKALSICNKKLEIIHD